MRVSSQRRTDLQTELDQGETAALAWAIDVDADGILLNEREGRAAACRHDVPTTGVVEIVGPCIRRRGRVIAATF